MCTGDTPAESGCIATGVSHNQDRHFGSMPDRVDRGPKHQIPEALVAMRTHHNQVRTPLFHVGKNRFPWTARMHYLQVYSNSEVSHRGTDAFEVLFSTGNLGTGGLGAVDLAGDAFFDV
jgi:hypothetical protein